MTKKTEELARKIELTRNKKIEKVSAHSNSDYQIAFDMLTNLAGCVLMGLALGVLFQNVFHTPVALTTGLTFFGGFVGLFQVIRQAIQMDRIKKVK